MKLNDLTTEEIKDIIKQLLYKVEPNKEVVDKNVRFRKVYVFQGKYCLNYDDGFDYKICSIDNLSANISSESFLDNVRLTEYYQELLKDIFRNKEQSQVVNI